VTDAGVIDVFYADRRAFTDDRVAALVTDADRKRCAVASRAERRAECLAGRALLRHALEQATGKSGAAYTFTVTPEGKPECAGGPAISLSHSGGIVACAVTAAGAVGIDVETRQPRIPAATLAEHHFTPFETAWVAGDPDRRFRMLWVLKEAYLKALGTGLAGGLRSLECRIEPPWIAASTSTGAPAPRLALFAGPASHLGVAWHGGPAQIRFATLASAACDDVGPFELMARTA
jgi:4'-phosphopantetheinyl transferase